MSSTQSVIVVIEDDTQICRFLRTSLSVHGFQVIEAGSGEQGLVEIGTRKPELVILDLGLPGMDGIEVIYKVRKWSAVPIIVLSARSQESNKISALDAGADDYLTKPFSFEELLARIRALLRRPPHITDKTVLQCANLKLDLIKRQTWVGEQEISLSQKEFALLEFLMRHAGEVVSRTAIAEHVWDLHFDPMSNTIDVYINFLRKKIGETPSKSKIETIRGTGYRLACP